ncbi:MAG: hypothetical protein ACK4KT_07395 [Thermaurantimonas sp.]
MSQTEAADAALVWVSPFRGTLRSRASILCALPALPAPSRHFTLRYASLVYSGRQPGVFIRLTWSSEQS